MDNSCGKCISGWDCAWCKDRYCDDVCCPYVLKGKAIKNELSTYAKINSSPKQIKKWMKFFEEEEPVPQQFFLCETCKNKYIEKNICKGRYSKKIGQNRTTCF
jgi:hypothetical protein